jgi:hypothetical protein
MSMDKLVVVDVYACLIWRDALARPKESEFAAAIHSPYAVKLETICAAYSCEELNIFLNVLVTSKI